MSLPISATTPFYSPYNFLAPAAACAAEFARELDAAVAAGAVQCHAGSDGVQLYVRRLDWDSAFFGVPTYRLDYSAIPAGAAFGAVQASLGALQRELAGRHASYYLFAEVPSEDTAAIAGMGSAGWRLIETRLTCFRDDLQSFSAPERSAVRGATAADIPALRQAAMEAVNHYDRFHADDFFSAQMADDFLAIFVENSVKGYADEVIVPAEGPADAFLTGNYLGSPAPLAGRQLGKMVLSAVTPARRGWYTRLIGELSYRFKERGVEAAYMTTQATNRAVLKVWARHGYRIGRCTHIFSTYLRKEAA